MQFFFDNWESLIRTFIITVLAYAFLILALRSSGKRTLSKMNAFDLVVTIALGSVLATVILNKNVPLADGMLAFSLLILLQFIISYLSVRSDQISNLVKSSPALLVYKGNYIRGTMRRERINEDEILAVLRENGLSSLEEAGAVVLETDGSLSVVKEADALQTKVFSKLRRPDS